MKKLAVVLCVFAFCAALYLLGAFSYLENKTYDNRMSFAADFIRPADNICFIAVDQESINRAQKEKRWGWPWPRSAYGDIVRYMHAGGAQSVLFDILFTEPSVYGPEDDNAFAAACADYGKVAQTMYVSGDAADVLFPIDAVKKSAGIIANITSAKDGDDIIRRGRLSFNFNGAEYATFGTAPIAMDEGMESVANLADELPVLDDGTLLLRYQKGVESYLPYRAWDILESYYAMQQGREPLIPPDNFADCTVYVAYYAPGLFDICSVPMSQVYPGVGVHITMFDNILNRSFVRSTPLPAVIVYLLLVAFAALFIINAAEKRKTQARIAGFMACGAALCMVMIIAAAYALFAASIWIPLVAPLACFILSFGAELFLSYITEGKQRRFIKSAFSQYLSPVVIDTLIANPTQLKLGGEKRNITVYFSDLQGFTSISEKLAPEALTELLNGYLSEMTDIILGWGGTIDKYEGDAIIAFWNAPTEEPDHAMRGISAAIACQERLAEINPELSKIAGAELRQRIGLNTGYAVVGNMGSRSRFDYTMLGDTVNLASRLEGLNKQFGTYTMCSAATKQEAETFGCNLAWRELARVAVVGKKEAVTVYEPMQPQVFEDKRRALDLFEQARLLFYAGDFAAALALFEQAQAEDAPCGFYAARCRELIASPPSAWDGVWHSREK